ncbi:SpoIIE family protein phosphatase [Pseudonocardia halophobica]|uniref:SpoIIE family protein phosphatase n=1 Tax=Pseudonocardia halophobica TaxID=29401 RepID=UPI003D8F668C
MGDGVARQLEPGDRLLFYSDGTTEARDAQGAFFGENRLIKLTERAAAAELSAPETLRRLGIAVMEHQDRCWRSAKVTSSDRRE